MRDELKSIQNYIHAIEKKLAIGVLPSIPIVLRWKQWWRA